MFIKKGVYIWLYVFNKLNFFVKNCGHNITIPDEIFFPLTEEKLEIEYLKQLTKNIYIYDNLINKIHEMIEFCNIKYICLLGRDTKCLFAHDKKFYLPGGIDAFIDGGYIKLYNDEAFLEENNGNITLCLKDFYFSYEWFLNNSEDFKKNRKLSKP